MHSSRKNRPAASHEGGPGAKMFLPDIWVDVRAHNEYSRFFSYISSGRFMDDRSVGICTRGMIGYICSMKRSRHVWIK